MAPLQRDPDENDSTLPRPVLSPIEPQTTPPPHPLSTVSWKAPEYQYFLQTAETCSPNPNPPPSCKYPPPSEETAPGTLTGN